MPLALRIVTLLMTTILVLTACASPQQPAATVNGGTLVRAMTSEPASLDPQGAASSGLSLVVPYIFDTLVTRQADGKYVGLLAESWQVSPDSKSVEMKLKKGVKFHDGSPLNAAAVVFTFERFKTEGGKSPIAANVKEITRIEPIDELTLRFSFDKPTATFWNTLSMPYASILSPAAVKAAGEEMGAKPVGSGPFKLEEWKRGVSMSLVRNSDYNWGTPEVKNRGPVHIDQLLFKLIPDASTQLAALQAGDVDVIFTNEPGHLAKLENDKSVQVQRANLDALVYLGFNSAKPPFDEVKVRQALSHAVNKSEIIKTSLAGMGSEALTPLVPSMLGYNAELKSYGQGYDPAKAKTLLTEAGFTQAAGGAWQRDGKTLAGKLLTSNRAPNEAIATVLQSQFKSIGVQIEIQQLDSAAAMKATTEGAFDLLLWRYDWSDPDALNTYLSSKRIRETNRVFYGNPKVDELLERGAVELAPDKRSAIYQEAQKIILNEAPWQPLYMPSEALVFHSRVKGVVMGPMARMLVNDITLGEK